MSNQMTELLWPITAMKRALVYSATGASFPSIIPTVTQPVTVDAASAGSNVWVTRGGYRYLALTPFGVGADNTTWTFKVYGWSLVSTLWVPNYLAGFTCTNSTSVGVAGAAVIATERFVDTLVTLATPVDDPDVIVVSPTVQHIAQVFIPTRGHAYLEAVFAKGSGTDGNFLYRYL